MKCPTEIAISDRREAELAKAGFIPLIHRKGTDHATFIGAQSLQKPQEYMDPDATANANLSARLPYLFASTRFAHYLKSIVRDKVGAFKEREEMQTWLNGWIMNYVDADPANSSHAIEHHLRMHLFWVGLQHRLEREQALQQAGRARQAATRSREPHQHPDVLAAQQQAACIALDLGPVGCLGPGRKTAVLHLALRGQARLQHGMFGVVLQARAARLGLAHGGQQQPVHAGRLQGRVCGIAHEGGQQLSQGVHVQ